MESERSRVAAAAAALGTVAGELPERVCLFAGMYPAGTPDALAFVRDVLETVDQARGAGMAGWMLGHAAHSWPDRPSAATPLAGGVRELGDRLAARVVSRTPVQLREIAAGLGMTRHQVTHDLYTALHAAAAAERWLENETGAPRRPVGVWDGEAAALEWNLEDDHVEDLTDALTALEPGQWEPVQVQGMERAVLAMACTLAGHVIDLAASLPSPPLDWIRQPGETLRARLDVPGAAHPLTLSVFPVHAQARVKPLTGQQRDAADRETLWPGTSPREARAWGWELTWPGPDGTRINYEAQQAPSREAACWAAGQHAGHVLADPSEVRQPLTHRLLVPRMRMLPGRTRVVDLRTLLEAVAATSTEDLDPRRPPQGAARWPALPHCDSEGLLSLPGILMDHLNMPWPHAHEPLAQLPVDDPAFAAHLTAHGFALTPAAWAYFSHLASPGPEPLPLRERHAAAMTAVLAMPEANPVHLTAELGPLPTGMEWSHLLIPFRLNDFLRPADDESDGSDDERPPWQ
ncbi:hypothetical protein [Streptomyces sp. NPDC050485]|uniref:hypothetical protein n=1 Tax=Streptomyces sp. NPDC050485 TaxID=3365617 RepID=UPI0037B973AB